MKTLLLAAVAAIAVSAAASAAEVEFYGATEEFAKMMGNCYDAAPAGLRAVLAKPHAPQLIATKDNVTFGRLGPVLRASAEWMKGSSGLFVGSSFEGSTNGVNRFIAIMEDLHRGTSGK